MTWSVDLVYRRFVSEYNTAQLGEKKYTCRPTCRRIVHIQLWYRNSYLRVDAKPCMLFTIPLANKYRIQTSFFLSQISWWKLGWVPLHSSGASVELGSSTNTSLHILCEKNITTHPFVTKRDNARQEIHSYRKQWSTDPSGFILNLNSYFPLMMNQLNLISTYC